MLKDFIIFQQMRSLGPLNLDSKEKFNDKTIADPRVLILLQKLRRRSFGPVLTITLYGLASHNYQLFK